MQRSPLPAAVLLVVLLAAMDLWSMHHFGIGIRDPGLLAVVLAGAGAAWGLVAWLLTEGERETAASRVRAPLRRALLSPAPVLLLGAAFAVAVLLFSSVTVVAEPGAEPAVVQVVALGDSAPATGTLDRDAPQVRFPVLSSPLAGTYVVRAAGYLPTLVEAAPLLGARVVLGRDLGRSPSVLVRPAGPLMDALALHGHIAVARRSAGGEVELARSDPGETGSFLLGRRPASLRERIPDWERELLAAGVTDVELRSHSLQSWLSNRRLPFEGSLVPGDTLVVRLFTRAGEPQAEALVVLGTDDEDVFLRPEFGGGS